MIKVAAAANRHPTHRSLTDFQRYWAETHGPLFSNTVRLRRYVQHLTLPEAYGHSYAPTFDGVSVFWFDDVMTRFAAPASADALELQRAVVEDDAQLFDRGDGWPAHLRRASVVAEEVVIKEGAVRPDMVKTLVFACRLPGLSLNEFFAHWRDVHGPLGAAVPGLRRYVQNHALPAAYAWGTQTYDGWAEMWFDDLDAVYTAIASPDWQRLRQDGDQLFTRTMGLSISRELVQKDLDWSYRDFGVGELDEAGVAQRLADEGYNSLAADRSIPAKIKAAAASGRLAVWTPEHLVTIDASRLDARPDAS
jgi:uncharacterized protein (TIGR02118 family)